LPVLRDLTDAYKLWHGFLPHLPRLSRYTLCAKIDALKFFLKLAWETKLLDHKRYAVLAGPLSETGKMLGGWRKHLSS
jgi:hypothetical protein